MEVVEGEDLRMCGEEDAAGEDPRVGGEEEEAKDLRQLELESH